MKIKIFFLILLSTLIVNAVSGQKTNKKIIVSGIVKDAMKRSVAEAKIYIDGEDSNVVTNNKGVYKVRVPADADTITIMSLDNGISSAAINGRTQIDFTLTGTASLQQNFQDKPANEEEVNVGYGNVKRKNLITPVSTIDGKGGRYSSYRNIFEILRGTAGVQVNGTSIKIQGQSSLTLSTEPLFIVDGMVVESIDNIPPSMVESIAVLKGASASIYGSRGANGVILITLTTSSGIK